MSLKTPKSPSTWAEYAQSPEIKNIPFTNQEYLKKEAKIQVSRAVYLAYPSVVKAGYETARLFAEVISIDKSIVIDLQTAAEVTLCARVLTSDGDVQLELVPPTDKSKESILSFYADKLEHPLSYTIRGTSHKGTLNWGPDAAVNKDKVGVHLYFGHDQGTDNPVVEYLDHYRDAARAEQFSKSLETQLRIASVLFWAAPSIAASQAAYIAKASAKSSGHELINLQAVNFGEQLAAQALAGPNMNYAPILDMERYEKTADAFIKAAEKYEEQYYRFEDRAQSTEHRLEAWDNMISRVQGLAKMRKDVTETASVKYDEAVKIVQTLHKQVENTKGLEDAQHKLNIGIKTWQNDMKLKAAFQIIKAVMDFALAIGLLCVGAPPVGNPVGEAVEAVEAVEKAGSAILKVSSSTLKTLKDCIDMVEKLYPAITQAADSIKLVESGKMDQVTKISEISGGAATAGSIGAIAAWDKWILQSDDQLEFPISQGINGATDYRLELRKYAIDAKALIQAQVEAIKAGQEYIRARLEQSLAESDLKKLDELKGKWEKDRELEEEAGARFYDRFLTLRVSIVMEMRNMMWAYKYKALEDSKVALGAQKSTADYREDYATILREDNNYLSKYPRSFSINEPQRSQDLPVPYRSQFLENLKKAPYSATFVLVPSPKNTKDEQKLAGPFNEGEHFRISRLQVILVGAVPKPGVSDHRHGDFQLRISTSGVYADIRDDKIFNFAMKPITGGLFNYSKNGKDIDVRESSFDQDPLVSKEFAPPTPFTQWTISIKNADQLDLEKLTDVEIHWAGTAFTVPSTRR